MKMHRVALWTMAAALAGAGTAAAGQDVGRDVRCLLVSNAFSAGAKDPKARQIAMVAGFFYLGRLDGKLTDAQLETRIRTEQKTITNANAPATMQQCGQYMQQRGQALQAIGRRLAPAKK